MERPGEAVQDHYPDGFAHCFGCGRLNPHGHHIRTFRDGVGTLARFRPQPHHLAVPGFAYGGLVASLIDCHGIGTAADAELRRAGSEIGTVPTPRYVTAALHVDYLRPTPIGVELELRGRVTDATGRKIVVEVTVTADGEPTARGQVIAVPVPESMAGGR